MDQTGPGVLMPKLQDGTDDIFSMPDISNKKLHIFPLTTYEVIYSFVRTRLRKSKFDLSGLEELFTRRLPEFSSYVINQLYVEANGCFQIILPENIRIYKENVNNFTRKYDVQTYIDICNEYAGPPPITKRHFLKILHLTSLAAYRLAGCLLPSVKTKFMNRLMSSCFTVFETQGYSDYLNEHPWHTWFNPLMTFPVTSRQVVRTVVRSRLCKIFNLDQMSYKELFSKHGYRWLFEDELPEWSHYQIRCIIDELEDLEQMPDVFPPGTFEWLEAINSTTFYTGFHWALRKHIFNSETQPMGILKVILISCLMIEKFFSLDIYSSAIDVMASLIVRLEGPCYKDILSRHPWHTWYKQKLPWPTKKYKVMSRYTKTSYYYPVRTELDF